MSLFNTCIKTPINSEGNDMNSDNMKIKQLISFMIVLVMLTAVPIGVYAQDTATSDSSGGDVGVAVEPIPEPWVDMAYWWPDYGFDYSNGTADGTHVDLELDETTGTVTDYTVTMVRYDYYYPVYEYDLKYEDEEDDIIFPGEDYPVMPEPEEFVVKFFDSMEFEDFVPNGHPATFGDTLTFLGENVIMTFMDYEWSMTSFMVGEDNQTIVLNVADGFEISEQPYWYDMYELDDMEYWEIVEEEYTEGEMGIEDPIAPTWAVDEDYANSDASTDYYPSDDVSVSTDDMYYDPYMSMWQWDEVYITNDDVTCSIWIENGEATIDGNTITLEITEGGSVGISAMIEEPYYYDPMYDWGMDDGLYYDDLDIDMDSMIEEGLLAAVGSLFVDEMGEEFTDTNTYNDPSFRMDFIDIDDGSFVVEVESKIEEGRIVSINLDNDVLDDATSEDIQVLLDYDDEIEAYDSIEDLAELVGGTEAGYFLLSGEDQSIIFVYVPHFSTHTISVQSIASELSSPSILMPGILAITFITLAVMLVVMRNKKGKEEF